MVGQKLGHYNITKELGQGGMGAVYLADDTRLKRQVAVKVLPESVSKDPERLRRFRIEAEAAAQLNHPNIAQIFSFEDVDGPDGTTISIIAMEYVHGQTLTADGGLPLDTFYEWFIPLADALAHAHEQGVTHRDLKPTNIMIREVGTPKILNFGLAGIAQDQSDGLDSNVDGQRFIAEQIIGEESPLSYITWSRTGTKNSRIRSHDHLLQD